MVGSTGFPCQDWCCRVALEVTSESTGWSHRYQAACILNVATERSLVIVDELGKDAKYQTVLPKEWPFKISKLKNVNEALLEGHVHDWLQSVCWEQKNVRWLQEIAGWWKTPILQKVDLITFGTYALRSWNFNRGWLWNRLGHCKTFGWGLEQALQKICILNVFSAVLLLEDVTVAHKSLDFCRTPDASRSLPLTSTSWQL